MPGVISVLLETCFSSRNTVFLGVFRKDVFELAKHPEFYAEELFFCSCSLALLRVGSCAAVL